MAHLEGKEAVVRHLRAKFQGNRNDPSDAGGQLDSRSAASPATEPGQTPAPGSKGKMPPECPWTKRVDFSRASSSHSKGQSMGQHLTPHPVCETARREVQLKKENAQGAGFPPVIAKPRRVALNKEMGATSDPPLRHTAQQTQPLAKDKGPPTVPGRGAAAAASLDTVGSPHRTGHPSGPRRKPLPHVKGLGARPPKPRRPPVVDLEKFGVAPLPGMRVHPVTETPKSAQPGYLRTACIASTPAQLPPQDAPTVVGDKDEIYDDIEPVGLVKSGQGFLLPPTSRPPAHPHARGGGDTGQASNRAVLLAAAHREAPVSHKVKQMTFKECKKEEKADRDFQKKFKFEGSINVLTQMMVDPAATEKRGGGKNLPLRRGEILDVIQFTNQEQILCRNSQRRYGYVPRAVMLHLDTDIYDDVEIYG
ncbi:PML-RARA-regulated adapter molecule 1 [Phaenicophaeus curvirostris]|uniref:PML-RARA-regulated adapter molecule 1 n=1 Tax=Phaenicophaeus curvirostris TaxID=33595 RepID=UPI0037F0AA9F